MKFLYDFLSNLFSKVDEVTYENNIKGGCATKIFLYIVFFWTIPLWIGFIIEFILNALSIYLPNDLPNGAIGGFLIGILHCIYIEYRGK